MRSGEASGLVVFYLRQDCSNLMLIFALKRLSGGKRDDENVLSEAIRSDCCSQRLQWSAKVFKGSATKEIKHPVHEAQPMLEFDFGGCRFTLAYPFCTFFHAFSSPLFSIQRTLSFTFLVMVMHFSQVSRSGMASGRTLKTGYPRRHIKGIKKITVFVRKRRFHPMIGKFLP